MSDQSSTAGGEAPEEPGDGQSADVVTPREEEAPSEPAPEDTSGSGDAGASDSEAAAAGAPDVDPLQAGLEPELGSQTE